MNTMFPFICLLTSLLIYGCGEINNNPPGNRSGEMIKNETEKDIYKGLIPYDQPIWEKGATFSRETMAETVQIRTEGLYRVFREMQNDYPGLQGKITAHFYVNPDGSVSDVEIIESDWSELQGEVFEDSLITHLQKWTFPPGATKPIGVTQPWTFEPSKLMESN